MERIKRHDFKSFRPLLIAAMVKGISEENLIELLKTIYGYQTSCYRLAMPTLKSIDNQFYRMGNAFFHDDVDWTLRKIIGAIRHQKEKQIFSLFNMGR